MPTDPNVNPNQPADAGKNTTPAAGAPNQTGDGKAAEENKQDPAPKQSAGADEGGTLLGKAPEAKEGDAGQKAGDKSTEDLELKFPEGVKLDEGLLTGFKDWAKEAGIKADVAQKLANVFVEHQKAREQAEQQAAKKLKEEWVGAIKADKELGGANLSQTLAVAAKAIDRFGGAGLRKLLDVTGFGDSPDFIRAFYRIGKELSEDSLSGAGSNPARGEASEEDRLNARYPSMAPKKSA